MGSGVCRPEGAGMIDFWFVARKEGPPCYVEGAKTLHKAGSFMSSYIHLRGFWKLGRFGVAFFFVWLEGLGFFPVGLRCRLGLLGCGGFGAVELVEETKSGNMFALKALSKGFAPRPSERGRGEPNLAKNKGHGS